MRERSERREQLRELDDNELARVIGGADGDALPPDESSDVVHAPHTGDGVRM